MKIHQTPEFKEWYSKQVITQPAGSMVHKDFAMLCWIISYSGRIAGVDVSYSRFKNNYLKFRPTMNLYDHDEQLFAILYDKYNMKTAEQLGLEGIRMNNIKQFTTDNITTPHREYSNVWTETTACESR